MSVGSQERDTAFKEVFVKRPEVSQPWRDRGSGQAQKSKNSIQDDEIIEEMVHIKESSSDRRFSHVIFLPRIQVNVGESRVIL